MVSISYMRSEIVSRLSARISKADWFSLDHLMHEESLEVADRLSVSSHVVASYVWHLAHLLLALARWLVHSSLLSQMLDAPFSRCVIFCGLPWPS